MSSHALKFTAYDFGHVEASRIIKVPDFTLHEVI